MKSMKLIVGAIGALVAIAYCGGLLYYFVGTAGSFEDAQVIGLGPTMLGLAIIGFLFCVAFLVKFVRIFAATRPAEQRARGSDASTPNGEPAFDADAAIARYMAKRPVDTDVPTAPRAKDDGRLAGQPTFGRRIR